MKKMICGLLAFLCVFAVFGQNIYWTAYNIEVKNGEEGKVVAAFDQFFSTPTGKAMPTAQLNAVFFKSSEQDFTHQMIFSSTEKSAFGKMYGGEMVQSNDFALLASVLDQHTKGKGSYLGRSLIFEPIENNRFSTIISTSVSDPATYAKEFQVLKAEIRKMLGGRIGFDLHQVLSGNEEDVTHVSVVTAPDFVTMLEFTDMIYASPAFAKFAAAVGDSREVISNHTTMNVKMYNVPDMGSN